MSVLWDEDFKNTDNELLEQFEKKVKTGKGDSVEVYVRTIEEAKETFRYILSKKKPKNLIVYKSHIVEDFLSKIDLVDLNIFFNGGKKEANMADIGISEMDFAIAETGTLVEYSYPIWKRFVSAMPSLYIALVRSNRVVKDFESAFKIIKDKIPQSKHISFITGPSITADIERVLAIGVHGPSELIVFFIKET